MHSLAANNQLNTTTLLFTAYTSSTLYLLHVGHQALVVCSSLLYHSIFLHLEFSHHDTFNFAFLLHIIPHIHSILSIPPYPLIAYRKPHQIY
ncbi:hypothetical protein F5879DRAFT_933238 [Lentinula edodes]|nr:hypothetical protein F5879DRAFT_933238 [Lentinula edodes]